MTIYFVSEILCTFHGLSAIVFAQLPRLRFVTHQVLQRGGNLALVVHLGREEGN